MTAQSKATRTTRDAQELQALRATRREAQRQLLIRRSAAARAAWDAEPAADGEQSAEQPASVSVGENEPERTGEDPSPFVTRCSSWRAAVVKQAYLSTLPPPDEEAEPLRRRV